jgi:hypothetical protein
MLLAIGAVGVVAALLEIFTTLARLEPRQHYLNRQMPE